MTGRPLKVYLCDLTHDSVILVSDTIPINIGFIGAYAKKIHGSTIELDLFKYPGAVIQALRTRPPDVIALSNYSWNSRLSEHITKLAKESNPGVITVQGGTNFPHKPAQQLEFLLARPATDVYVELEAEAAFSALIDRIKRCRDDVQEIFESPMPGCVFVRPDTRESSQPLLVKGDLPPRIKDLDEIPSPYLQGFLDGFFDGRLTPFLETNRGCPFKCTFCHTGADYFQKINMFSHERIVAEIAYIAPRAASFGIANLHLADTNFGMYPRDKAICEALLQSQERHGWPRQIMATTGKNNKERVIAITEILGNVFSVNMSVQSMNSGVLKNIKRDNIRLGDYERINQYLIEKGRSTKGEVIIGLPGETRESFVRGIEEIIDAGVTTVCSYTLMLLHGTEFKDPDYRAEFSIKGKHRIVPLNFGEYAGERVFDTEEVGISTKTMSFDDYVWIRGISLFVEAMHNNRPYEELIRYGISVGLTRFEIIKRCYDSYHLAPVVIREVIDEFTRETKAELWNSEEELIDFYRCDEQYSRLLAGEAGGNLIYKYKAVSLAFCNEEWTEYIGATVKVLVQEKQAANLQTSADCDDEIQALVDFVRSKLKGLLDVNGDVAPCALKSFYDIVTWLKDGEDRPLSDFALTTPIVYSFEYTPEQLATRKDYFRRYGTDNNALSKIVTRVSNVESLFRKVRVLNSSEFNLLQSEEEENDLFIRYTLSN